MHNARYPARLNFYPSGRRYRALLIFVWPRHKATSKRPHGFGAPCEIRYQTQSSPPGYLVLAKFARSSKRSVTAIATGNVRKLIRGMAMHPADTCLLSPRASHGMKLLLALAYAAAVGYACLCRQASEHHYSAGGLDRVASRDNSVNCRSTPGTGWPAIC